MATARGHCRAGDVRDRASRVSTSSTAHASRSARSTASTKADARCTSTLTSAWTAAPVSPSARSRPSTTRTTFPSSGRNTSGRTQNSSPRSDPREVRPRSAGSTATWGRPRGSGRGPPEPSLPPVPHETHRGPEVRCPSRCARSTVSGAAGRPGTALRVSAAASRAGSTGKGPRPGGEGRELVAHRRWHSAGHPRFAGGDRGVVLVRSLAVDDPPHDAGEQSEITLRRDELDWIDNVDLLVSSNAETFTCCSTPSAS